MKGLVAQSAFAESNPWKLRAGPADHFSLALNPRAAALSHESALNPVAASYAAQTSQAAVAWPCGPAVDSSALVLARTIAACGRTRKSIACSIHRMRPSRSIRIVVGIARSRNGPRLAAKFLCCTL